MKAGEVWQLVCERCGVSFTWTAPSDTARPPAYHGTGCQKKAQRARVAGLDPRAAAAHGAARAAARGR